MKPPHAFRPVAILFFLLLIGGCSCSANVEEQGPLSPEGEPPTNPDPIAKSHVGLDLMLVKAGEFEMGAPASDKEAAERERPRHRVKITRPYYLGKTETTIGQFRQFTKATGYKTDAENDGYGTGAWKADLSDVDRLKGATWEKPGYPVTDEHPVTCVSHADAQAFLKWLGEKDGVMYRLPTEAEWEFATRGGTTSRWWFGDNPDDLGKNEWFSGNAEKTVHPVGKKAANPLGLHDTLGNVREMCRDWLGDYSAEAVSDPTGPEKGDVRVGRGGDVFGPVNHLRSTYRGRSDARFRFNFVGFRVCRPL